MLKNVRSKLVLRVETKLTVLLLYIYYIYYYNDHNQAAYGSGLDTSKYYWVKMLLKNGQWDVCTGWRTPAKETAFGSLPIAQTKMPFVVNKKVSDGLISHLCNFLFGEAWK